MDEPIRLRAFDRIHSLAAEVTIFGLWLIISPVVMGVPGVIRASLPLYFLGTAIAVLGAIRHARPWGELQLDWAIVVLGFLVMAAPLLLGSLRLTGVLANDVIMGFGVVWYGVAITLSGPSKSWTPRPLAS